MLQQSSSNHKATTRQRWQHQAKHLLDDNDLVWQAMTTDHDRFFVLASITTDWRCSPTGQNDALLTIPLLVLLSKILASDVKSWGGSWGASFVWVPTAPSQQGTHDLGDLPANSPCCGGMDMHLISTWWLSCPYRKPASCVPRFYVGALLWYKFI